MAKRITAIRKPGGAQSTHEHITDVKARTDGQPLEVIETVGTVISNLKAKQRYYVYASGNSIDVTIGTKNGNEHIKTKPDGTLADNLLHLPLF